MNPSSPAVFTFRMCLVLAVLGLAIFPVYWMAVTALTPEMGMFDGQFRWLPDFSEINVFAEAVRTTPILTWLRNSAIVATGTMAVSIVLAILPAYAMSRMRIPGIALFALALFVTQMLPEAMLVVPLYAIFGDLGLLNSLLGLILINGACTVPVIAWILKGAIDAIPIEVEEAAIMDGSSRFNTVLLVIVPLIAPTIAATSVIAFFNGWNEYLFAQTFISDEALKPTSVGLASFVGELSTPIRTVMSVGLIYTLPAVFFYLLVQRYVVSGMVAGSVKG